MTITAKFAGKCSCCGGKISVGDKIEWSKGSPTRHAKCPANPEPAAPKPRKASAPRLPKMIGDEGAYRSEYEGDKRDRTPQRELGEVCWLRDRGARIAVVLCGYEPARWVSADMAEDMGHYGVRSGYYGTLHYRAATPAEYEALQARDPRLDGVCVEAQVAVAITKGCAALAA